MSTTPRTFATLFTILVAASGAALGAAGCGGGDPPAAPSGPGAAKPADGGAAAGGPVSGVVGRSLVSATARVTAVDVSTRLVTLRRDDGKTMTIRAGEEVRNLPQVKVGDDVNVSYYESLAYEVKKPGDAEPGAVAAGAAARAKEGETPGAAAGQVVRVTATIAAIDLEGSRITLKGADGSEVVVKVRDTEKLARVAVGELLEITYSEALAVSVTTAPAVK